MTTKFPFHHMADTSKVRHWYALVPWVYADRNATNPSRYIWGICAVSCFLLLSACGDLNIIFESGAVRVESVFGNEAINEDIESTSGGVTVNPSGAGCVGAIEPLPADAAAWIASHWPTLPHSLRAWLTAVAECE